ncbi:MAG: hypothetical protein ACK2TV_04210 [Anaerolineales bacterium]|jgi:hypothetical protein
MENSPMSAYIGLLEIRLKGSRRNLFITCSAALLALLCFFALGMVGILGNQKEIFLSGFILVFLGLSFITTLIRHEVLKSALELAHAISRAE